MRNSLITKLTIIIEATSYKSISDEVMKRIYDLEKSIVQNPELRVSLVTLNKNDKPKKTESISPENWDYWPV